MIAPNGKKNPAIPDTELIAITCADGSCAIMAFVTIEYTAQGVPRRFTDPTDSAIDTEIGRASKSFDPEKLPIKSWRRIAREEIPTDRVYRDALTDTGRKLSHDMEKARTIHRELLRSARTGPFHDLDVHFMRAIEEKDQKAIDLIASQKQALRDITAHDAIDAAKTIEDLHSIWPKELPRP